MKCEKTSYAHTIVGCDNHNSFLLFPLALCFFFLDMIAISFDYFFGEIRAIFICFVWIATCMKMFATPIFHDDNMSRSFSC